MKNLRIYNNHYKLLEKIAKGGFAEIYKAEEVGRRESIAIKIALAQTDPIYDILLRKEADLLNKFNHKNIVRFYHVPRLNDRNDLLYAKVLEFPEHPTFIVMEFLRGGTLGNYLQYVGMLSPKESVFIALEIARALDHVHMKGFAHNDLKLENIVFRKAVKSGEKFSPVLIDFGTATRVILPTSFSYYVTPPELIYKIKGHISPELDSNVPGQKIDTWGLGIILYRMVGGRVPFSGKEKSVITERILNQKPSKLKPLNPQISSDLESFIIDGCLEKNPEKRLTILEAGRFLNTIVDENTTATKSANKVKRLLRRFW